MALSVRDRLEIIELVAGYALAIDADDRERFLGIFREDAVLDSGGVEFKGHAGIVEWMENRLRRPGARLVRHFSGMPLLAGDGDKASGQTLCVILDLDENQNVMAAIIGTYFDDFEKTGGRWLIKRRTIRQDLNGRG